MYHLKTNCGGTTNLRKLAILKNRNTQIAAKFLLAYITLFLLWSEEFHHIYIHFSNYYCFKTAIFYGIYIYKWICIYLYMWQILTVILQITVLNTLRNWLGNVYSVDVRHTSSFSKVFTGLRPATLLKKSPSGTGVFLWILRNF